MKRLLTAAATWIMMVVGPAASASSTTSPEYRVRLDNSVEVWVAPEEAGHIGCVRLEADVGLRDEGPGTYGMVAVLGAALLRGATPQLPPGGAEKLGLDVGLASEVELDAASTALTLCGPPGALPRAMWLTGERIAGLDAAGAAFKVVRGAIWHGARGSRYSAVGRIGDALQTAMAQALGPRDGNNGFLSRINASRFDDVGFDRRLKRALSMARFRVVVTGPKAALRRPEVEGWVKRNLGPIPTREPDVRALAASPAGDVERRGRLRHQRDAAHLYVAAWDLRGVSALTGFSRVKNDAALFTLHQLIDRNGGPLWDALIDGHQVARRIETRLAVDDTAALAIEIEARSRDTRDVARLTLEEMSRLATVELSADLVRGAGRAVAQGIRARWHHAAGRAALVSQVVGSGRIERGGRPSQWVERFITACTTITPRDIKRYAGFALTDDRRVGITMLPARPARVEVDLTEALVDTYRRIVVDVRCGVWGEQASLKRLLDKKYRFSPRRYVEVTRALTRQRPGLMRQMIRDADLVCGEWRRLAELVGSRSAALALHRAVACGPARVADDRRRDAAMAAVFRKRNLDPSVYRPLLNMLRADVDAADSLASIDKKCRPKYGQAAP